MYRGMVLSEYTLHDQLYMKVCKHILNGINNNTSCVRGADRQADSGRERERGRGGGGRERKEKEKREREG